MASSEHVPGAVAQTADTGGIRRHNRVTRFLSRLVFRLLCLPLAVVARVHHRTYMYFYVPLLRTYGMRLTGTPRYIGVTTEFDDLDNIELGDDVVISAGCTFLTHDYSLTTALAAIGRKPATDTASVRGIRVGNNVFIGKGTIMMPNSTVGDNVIIGAGSVVRGVIPSNSIAMGNPAVVVGDIESHARKCEALLAAGAARRD